MTGPRQARKSFGSDNHAGTHPDVMRAIVEANTGDAVAYGADPWTERADRRAETARRRRGRGVPGPQRQRRERARARPAARPARGGHLRRDRAHQHRRVRRRRADTRHQAADGPRAGRQDHARADRQPPGRARRRALRPAGRGRRHPVDRVRHLLLPRGTARDQGVLRGQPAARLTWTAPGWPTPRRTSAAPSPSSPRARTCSASAAPRTARWASRPSSSCTRRRRQRAVPAQAAHAALVQDALPRRAVQRAARRTTSGCGTPPTPTRWPPGSPTAWPACPGWRWSTRSRRTRFSPAWTPSHVAALQRDWTFHVWDETTSTVRWMTAFDTEETRRRRVPGRHRGRDRSRLGLAVRDLRPRRLGFT